MKTYLLHTPSIILTRFPALGKKLDAELAAHARALPDTPLQPILLGGDLEKAGVCLAAAIGLQQPFALATLTRAETLDLIAAIRQRGFQVHVSVEACGFGWHFHDQMRDAGAASVVTLAPEPLTGKRKTNKRDAIALCRVLAARVIHHDAKAGRAVREPTHEEQTRRAVARHRGQLLGIREKQASYGRSLLHDLGIHEFPECWWGKKMWCRVKPMLLGEGKRGAFALEILAPLQQLLQSVHLRILELDKAMAKIHEQVVHVPMPKGLGAATSTRVALEFMDPHRFNNRKQVGSFIGCAVTEYSTGTTQTMGGIDKMGNGRLRSDLTEAVWRLKKWEPGWRGFAKFDRVLFDKTAGSVRRKKAVIACVRLLAIDLWRLMTGRITLADVGFKDGTIPGEAGGEEEAPTTENQPEKLAA